MHTGKHSHDKQKSKYLREKSELSSRLLDETMAVVDTQTKTRLLDADQMNEHEDDDIVPDRHAIFCFFRALSTSTPYHVKLFVSLVFLLLFFS